MEKLIKLSVHWKTAYIRWIQGPFSSAVWLAAWSRVLNPVWWTVILMGHFHVRGIDLRENFEIARKR